MKFVKRPISLPENLHRWFQAKVKREARDRGVQPNYSAAVATLIVEERRRLEGKKAA